MLAANNGREIPQNQFTEGFDLLLGERRLELWHAGPGHTTDNIVVWIPDEQVLFGGCLVRALASKRAGYIEEADLKAWPRTVAAVIEKYPDARLVVPGHGSPGAPGNVSDSEGSKSRTLLRMRTILAVVSVLA